MKKLSFLVLAAVGLLLGACSSDKDVVNSGGNESKDAKGYLSVQIKLPTTPVTRTLNDIYDSIQIAVEDLFSATKYILDNAEEVDIDPSSLVIAGSSAGAITVLQAEWELCNRTGSSVMLPIDFRYAGVMSFAGAIYSKRGTVHYTREPSPTLLFHGTADRIVTYRQIHLFNLAFQGSNVLARIMKGNGFNCCIYRYKDNSHEIAAAMSKTFPEQLAWLEHNIIGKEKRIIDATVNDPSIEVFQVNDLKTLYSGAVTLE